MQSFKIENKVKVIW